MGSLPGLSMDPGTTHVFLLAPAPIFSLRTLSVSGSAENGVRVGQKDGDEGEAGGL